MKRARKQTTCFNCQKPTTAWIQSRAIKARRFICNEAACWERYYADADNAEKGARKA